ncbi:hypothetical protein FISHEDRAFT_59248 [Fistulina hepatica ATCC 64428]|uniref:Uncharacterized protein n=1 Tax=Fistulina hepatica ATCC 64428 TaxID=1128425 RepID=A0A0D7ACB2_9AGAR|nr:hypothetical protein FISHEDRAFT_59248 [Fistulina hepatica ATCC 64428]
MSTLPYLTISRSNGRWPGTYDPASSLTPKKQAVFHFDKQSSLPPFLHPLRKSRHRTTILALIVLSLFSFLFFVHRSTSSANAAMRRSAPPPRQFAVAFDAIRTANVLGHAQAKPAPQQESFTLNLTPEEELAAVVQFIAVSNNALPDWIDPTVPIDPDVVLAFDTRSPNAANEIRSMMEEVWVHNPVVVFTKLLGAPARELKTILKNMQMNPEPVIINVDARSDGDVLLPLVNRVTGNAELPMLLIRGKTVGALEEIKQLDESGELRKMVTAVGVQLDQRRKKH